MNMKNLKVLVVFSFIVLISSLLLMTGCVKKESDETIKIWAILPLTGPAAFYGEWGMKGIELAVDEIKS